MKQDSETNMATMENSLQAEMRRYAAIPPHVPAELVRPFPYILGQTTTEHPHDFIAAIHEGPEVFWAERAINGYRGAWVPRRLEDLQKVFFDNEHFTVRDFPPFAKLVGDTWYMVPAEVDPPEHTALRAALNPLFTPKRMAALEDKIRSYAKDYIAGFKARGGCEFMSEFAFEFPIRVFLELMGWPQERAAQFQEWEHGLLHEPDIEKLKAATRSIVGFLREELQERRANPRDDFMTYALQVEADGKKLDEDQLLGFCFNLFIGGLDTVSTNIALQFRHLAEHPEDQARLRENPAMIPEAIDEFMRAYGAVATSRECIKDTTIRGVNVKRGDKVVMATFLGGRDPAAFTEPEKIILDRKPRHVSFGYGVHLCIGMHLARREMRIALEEFLSSLPAFRIAPNAVITSYLAAIIQPLTLPLVW